MPKVVETTVLVVARLSLMFARLMRARRTAVCWRSLGAVAVVSILMLAALPSAWAQSDDNDEANLLAVYVEGARAKMHRERIVALVPEGVEIIKDSAFKLALRRSGMRGALGYAMLNKRGRRNLLRVLRKAMDKSVADAAVIARVHRGRRGPELVLLYLSADEEQPLVDERIPLKGSETKQLEALNAALGDALQELAPEPEEPPPEDKPEDEDEPEDEPQPGDYKPSRIGSELFNAQLGLELGGRFFDYTQSDANSRNTRPYEVFGVPGLKIAAEVYPAATTDIIVLSDLGLFVGYTHFFGLSSKTLKEPVWEFGTTYNRFNAGLRFRYRIGDADDNPVVLRASGSAGFLNFSFDPADDGAKAIADEVADAEYVFMRFGVDARIPIGRFSIQPSFGYVGPLEHEGLYSRFQGASVKAIDLGLGAAVVIADGFEARGGFTYTRYFSSFEPQPGDAFVAGGALDQYLGLDLGVGYVY